MMSKLWLAAVLGLGITAGLAQTNVPSQAGALRVNSPKANERISQNFVHVTYQLVNSGVSASASPDFTIQLDGNDPVATTAYDYTFTSVTPGVHTITVTLVDANGMPIQGSSVATKFTVVDGNRPSGSPSSFLLPSSQHLVLSASEATPLPMLSLVGFAVLVGGICTAIRNR